MHHVVGTIAMGQSVQVRRTTIITATTWTCVEFARVVTIVFFVINFTARCCRCFFFLLQFVKIWQRMSEGNFVSYKKLSIDGQLIRLTFASVSKEEAHPSVVWAKTKKRRRKQQQQQKISILSFDRLNRNAVYVFRWMCILCVFVSDLNKKCQILI